MKTKYFGLVMVFLLVLSVGITYAHGSSATSNQESEEGRIMQKNNHEMMFESVDEMIDEMNEMHEVMTLNMESELKEEMDSMHESCMTGNFEDVHEHINEESDKESITDIGMIDSMMGMMR